MAAGRYSFVIEQGATLSLELQYKDSIRKSNRFNWMWR